ncbi:MAG TPA: gliding motility-associated C-terminal domain-containing protein, partial [Bacteroidia bacterium]|nr:gliding motility-associated C-terminal domain-containing protein [Bacteroidia bacterium]
NFYPFDVAITKFNTTGTALIYSTYLGGIDNEQPQSIVVDNSDQLCVIGRTWSGNFPVTAGAYDNSINGASDIFITKFNPAGTALIGSTFIGGSAEDGVNLYANFYVCDSLKFNYGDDGRSDIITDQAGNCYVASCTKSGNFPVTAGALQTVFGGGTQDGCVFKINSTLTSMIWSTYLGGSSNDAAYSIQLDATNTVYVAGGTSSTDFPATPGTIHPAYQGGSADGFATVIEPAGSFILTSSFIGTGFYDQVYFLQLDQSNNVYLFGQTQGSYPVTAGVYSNPNSGQFIHKLDPSLSSTFFSTVFGSGSLLPNISPCAFLVDTCENIYTSGWGGACIPWGNTGTTFGLPVTSNAFQSTTDGCDFYFFVLKKDAASLWYATFFGAPNPSEEHVDGGTSRFDKRGVIYQAVCAGCPGQSNFPTTPGAWSTTNGSSNCNLAVIKMDFDLINFSANASASPSDTICLGTNMNFLNTSVGAQNYIWDFGDGSPPDTSTNPSHLYNSAGIFVVTLVAIDSLSCIMSDTVQLFITVIAPPVVNLGNDSIFCTNPNLVLDAGNPGSAYLWSTGATTQTITVSSSGTYWVTVSNAVCADVDSITFQLLIPPNLGSDTILCAGLPLMLDAGNPGSAYQWNTGATSQTINVNASGIYTVTVTTPPCQYQDSINVTFVPIPIVDIGPDTLLCPGATLLLDAGNPGGIYSWNTGDSSQLITVNGNGIYGVLVSNGTCEESDSMQLQTIAPVNLGSDINLCDYVNVELSAPNVPGASYLWSTGAATSVINVYEAGTYWVTVNAGNCIINDTVNVDGGFSTGLYVPNCFTPNHDGKNDFFYAKGEDITDFHMMIFNRWGEKLFETMDMNESWSGNYNGEVVQIDVYVVVIEYTTRCSTKKIREFRHVTVER